MDSQVAFKIIEDQFGEDPQVKEVAYYAMSTLAVNDAVMQAMGANQTEVRNIPPKALMLMKKYDDGLIQNDFWQANYVPIKSQLALSDIKLTTLLNYGKYYHDRGDKAALRQIRAILMSHLDVLTVIAFFWKGVTFAEAFDAKFRLAVQLPEEYVALFAKEDIDG